MFYYYFLNFLFFSFFFFNIFINQINVNENFFNTYIQWTVVSVSLTISEK